jgi:hypothetical protein
MKGRDLPTLLPTMLCYLHTGPKVMESTDQGLKPLNLEPKCTFPPYKLFISGVLSQCHEDDMHLENESWSMVSTD